MTPYKSLFRVCTRPWFIVLTLLTFVMTYLYVDYPLAMWLHDRFSPFTVLLLNGMTLLGKNSLIFSVLTSLWIASRLAGHSRNLGHSRNYGHSRDLDHSRDLGHSRVGGNPFLTRLHAYHHKITFLLLCVLIPNLFCLIFKVILGRSRPDLLFNDHLYGFFGPHLNSNYWSLPSGHTTTITGFMLGLMILYPRYSLLYGLVTLMVVVSRVLLLQHYLTDVLVAMYLTVLEIGILCVFLERRKHQWMVQMI